MSQVLMLTAPSRRAGLSHQGRSLSRPLCGDRERHRSDSSSAAPGGNSPITEETEGRWLAHGLMHGDRGHSKPGLCPKSSALRAALPLQQGPSRLLDRRDPLTGTLPC